MTAINAAFWPPAFGLIEHMQRAGLLDRFTRYYDEAVIDMPHDYAVAMTGLEARVGTMQATRLADFVAARRRYAQFYRAALGGNPALAWIDGADGSTYSHIAVRVANREAVTKLALARGVQLGQIIDYSVPEMAAYRQVDSVARFAVAHALSRQTINLPVSGRFSRTLAECVVATMHEILAEQPAAPRLPTADRLQ
jgi:dTDP-4-amino-4,6-dideoxygalactose transaminase